MFQLYNIINTQVLGKLSSGHIVVGLACTCYHGCFDIES
jgi:hypothetical protein